jgi:hypothetical protein
MDVIVRILRFIGVIIICILTPIVLIVFFILVIKLIYMTSF